MKKKVMQGITRISALIIILLQDNDFLDRNFG